MASMSGTLAALQAHNDQLQNYLAEWSKKQQGLLEIMPMSSTSPWTMTGNSHPELADEVSAMNASSITAPTSADEGKAAALADLVIGETVGDSAKGRDSDAAHRPEHVVASTRAAMEHEKADGAATTSRLEGLRNELARQLQASLTKLKDLHRKEEIVSWMNDILAKLEDDVINFDIVDMDEKPVPQRSESTIYGRRSSAEVKKVPLTVRSLAGAVVRSKRFELLTAAVIVFNAVIMGISTDHLMKNLEGSESGFLKNVEIVFFSYYTLELFLRLIHGGRDFFIGEDRKWNLFDLFLVLMSTNELLEPLYSPKGGSAALNLSFLRLVRLVKMAKLLRMIRLMKMFRQLRLMLASITDSMQAVLWAGLLVAIINYVSSILFVSLCTTFLKDAAEQNVEISSKVQDDIDKYWCSVLTGMHSLLGATMGGQDWFSISSPLMEVGWACYVVFIMYMGFFLIVILNTFASLFVQVVFENQAQDNEAIIADELEKKDEYIEKLQDFYDQIDDDGDGFITFEEFRKHANDPKFQAWASHLDIDISDAQEFFEVLSNDGASCVDIETFVVGCIKLKGNARSVDMMAVYQLSKQIHKVIDECSLMLHVKKRHDVKVENKIKDVANFIQASNPLPLLTNLCRHQREILALTSQSANTKNESSSLKL